MPDFTFAIVNWNTRDLLERCLESIVAESTQYDSQILVADNASSDGSADMVASRFPQATLVRHDSNLGFSGAHESLFPLSTGRYHVLVNSDVHLLPGCLSAMDECMKANAGIGVLGPQIIGPDGSIEPTCRRFPTLGNQFLESSGLGRLFPGSRHLNSYKMGGFNHESPCIVDQVMGSFFLIRGSLLNEVGYLDTRFFMYYEEVDYCLRAHRAGHKVFFDSGARVHHDGGGSSRMVRVATIRRKMRSMYHYFRKYNGPWVYMPLVLICALDGITHVTHAVITGREPLLTFKAYGLGFWDVLTVRPSWGTPTQARADHA